MSKKALRLVHLILRETYLFTKIYTGFPMIFTSADLTVSTLRKK